MQTDRISVMSGEKLEKYSVCVMKSKGDFRCPVTQDIEFVAIMHRGYDFKILPKVL